MANKQTDCPFCTLGDRVLRENEYACAFLSNPRKVPGHFLVVPKRHIEKPWELTDTEIKDIFELIFFIEQKLVNKLGQGVDIRENYRPYQTGIKQKHIHFHVYPRYDGDYLSQMSDKYEEDLFTELDPSEKEEFSKILADD